MNLAVIGLGKLGLPLAALLASSGNTVKAYDSQEVVRRAIQSKNIQTNEPGLLELLSSEDIKLNIVESVSEAIHDVEVVFLIVPTPSLPTGHFTNEYLIDAISSVGGALRANQRIVIDVVSTVMPGSCDGPIREALEKSSGRKLDENLGLCYNPEFIALGSVLHDMEFPDMHLIGQSSEWAGEVVEKALSSIIKREVPSRRMNLKEAELVKIAVNNFVTMKISFANLLMQGSILLGDIDVDVVTNAIGLDSRIGGKYLKAAAAYGGPCFPRDTRALTAFYKDIGLRESLSQATQDINAFHSDFIADEVSKQVQIGSKVGIAGLSYKTGTTVTEESPGLALARSLIGRGLKVSVWDDEGATSNEFALNESFSMCNSAKELISTCNFILISRPLNDVRSFAQELDSAGKPFFDLWRQF